MVNRTSSTSNSEEYSYFSRTSQENKGKDHVDSFAKSTLAKLIVVFPESENKRLHRRSKSFSEDCGENIDEGGFPAELRKFHKHSKTEVSTLVEDRLKIHDSVQIRKQEMLVRTFSLDSIEKNHSKDKVIERKPSTPRQSKKDKIQRTESSRSMKKEQPEKISLARSKKLFCTRKSKTDFPYTLSSPSLTQEEWERNALRKLEHFSKGKEKSEPSRLIASFASTAVNTTTITRRLEEAQNLCPIPFLKSFLEMRNPKCFLKAIRKLHKNDRRILIKIIGGATTIVLLKLCLDKKVQKGWELHVVRTRQTKEACDECEMRVNFFGPSFDLEYPLSDINFSDVRDTFRSFIGKDADRHCFKFNGISTEMPEIDQKSEPKRKVDFMEWFISCCLEGAQFTGHLSPREQARLVCKGALKADEKNLLLKKLFSYLTKNPSSDFKTVLKELKHLSFSADFLHWACQNLADFLYIESIQDPKTIAQNAIEQFEKDFNLKILKRDVFCYRVLQSISFSAFSTVPVFLSQTYCPTLFIQALNQPLMKSFPTDSTRYEIRIDHRTGQYEATQIKLYTFYRREATEADRLVLGSVEVFWTVCGNIESEARIAKLSFRNFHFDEVADINSRIQIMKGFGFFQ